MRLRKIWVEKISFILLNKQSVHNFQLLPVMFFHNEFNKFNKTWARVLDSIYHLTLSLL